jgi:glycosyltransferase involved in cell wall biosynthesis
MNETTPVVSVLMPVYNGEWFLAEAIDSILGQTFADFEFVIIDDGSTDASPAILADYASRDPRIRVVRQAGAGIVAALNRGLAECRAPLVARMDADDSSLPTRLEQQVAFLAGHPRVAVVGTAFQLVSETGAAGPKVHHATGPAAISRGLRRGNCLAHPTVMMRRDAILAVGGYRESLRHAEDYDLWTRVGERHELANLPTCLVRYRVHGGQVSWAVAEAQVLGTLAVQGLARARCRAGHEPSMQSGMPDREFLKALGFSPHDIDYSIVGLIAGRITACDAVGMRDEAARVRRSLIDMGHGKSPRVHSLIDGALAWMDLRAAQRTGEIWKACKAAAKCAGLVAAHMSLAGSAVTYWTSRLRNF